MFSKDTKTICILAGTAAASLATAYILLGPSGGKKRKRKTWCPPGLINSGNSCFANALLQALAPCRSARLWLAGFVQGKQHGGNGGLVTAMHTALQVLNNEREESNDEYCASDVVMALKSQGWHIPQDEQDAHELFHVLTETLAEEMQLHKKTLSLFEAYKIQDAPLRSCGKNRMDIAVPLQQPQQSSPFTGTLTNQLQCLSCGHKNPIQHDYFDSLTLPIPSDFRRDIGLYQMLGNYMKRETVQVECKKCGPHSKFSKKLTIGRLPKCLCLHVQRTTWLNNGMPLKRHDHVHFPESLNMSAYVYQSLFVAQAGGDAGRGLLGGQQNMNATYDSPTTVYTNNPAVSMLQALHTHTPTPTTPHTPTRPSTLDIHHHHYPQGPPHSTPGGIGGLGAGNQRHSYRLAAVVCHLGDAFSGHFVTYRRVPGSVTVPAFGSVPSASESVQPGTSAVPSASGSGAASSVLGSVASASGLGLGSEWVYCSDTLVKPVTVQEVLGANAYMLFYDRILL